MYGFVASDNSLLTGICAHKRKEQKAQQNCIMSSINSTLHHIIGTIRSARMKLAEHCALMADKRNAYRNLVGKSENNLKNLGVDRRKTS
jgi:hypothetical protein